MHGQILKGWPANPKGKFLEHTMICARRKNNNIGSQKMCDKLKDYVLSFESKVKK